MLVRTHAGPLYALNAKSGKKIWQIDREELRRVDPKVNDFGVVIVVGETVWIQAGEKLYKMKEDRFAPAGRTGYRPKS